METAGERISPTPLDEKDADSRAIARIRKREDDDDTATELELLSLCIPFVCVLRSCLLVNFYVDEPCNH